MHILDLILNLVALLLWFGWRTVGIDRNARPAALSLASTIKIADRRPSRSWTPLATLLLLLACRTILYHILGPLTHWTPSLNLGSITLHFRIDLWTQALLFSFASFFQVLIFAYLCVLLLLLAGQHNHASDPLYPIIRAQFGSAARIPPFLLVLSTPLLGAGAWITLQHPFIWLGLMSPPPATAPLWPQATAFGLGLLLAWTYPIIVLLGIHLLNSYLYVGDSRWWHSLARTGHNLVRPLPLAIGRFDLAPAVGIALTLVASHYLARALDWLATHP